MKKKMIAGAIGIVMGTSAIAAPAHAVEISQTAYSSAPVLTDNVLQYHHDGDYWKDRRKADKKYWKQRRKAEKRYWKEREKHAKHHRKYHRDGYYYEPVYRDTRVWRGRDGRIYCRKRDGTTGLIIGGALGALLGREIDTRGDRTLGTVLGAAGGALLGREIDRGGCR